MNRPVLLLATRNTGKVREFKELLAGLPVDLRDLSDVPNAPEVDETGDTYAANACAKALTLARFSGLPTLADDSGLEIDALDGAPGIRSARFAGPDCSDQANIDLALQRLRDVPEANRTARFRCVLAVAHPDGRLLRVDGVCEGSITTAPHGAAGFGYDPIFRYPPAGRTFAEMPPTEKQAVSHRARACAALRPSLLAFLAGRTPENSC